MQRALAFAALALAGLQTGCGGTTGDSPGTNPPPSTGVSLTVSPAAVHVRAGANQQFTPTVSGSSNQVVTWAVGGASAGNAINGTITAGGLYTAPGALPDQNTVTITAVSAADSAARGSSTVTLWNPTPVLSSVSPLAIGTGSFSLTVNGSDFVAGAQVFFGSTALTTTLNSSTQLTAAGTTSANGTVSVYVANPNPGSSNSAAVNVQAGSGGGTAGTCGGMSLGQGAALNGFLPFPDSNGWNTNIATAAVDPNSSALINFIGGNIGVHADFGSGEYNNQTIGIPYVVVGSGQGLVGINFTAYGDESDPGPMPVPGNAPIEGYPNPGSGDRHVLVVDSGNCWLYEMDSSYAQSSGTWNADSAAVWDLQNNGQRPWTWTSADAAGLSLFAGLARYDEVANGAIHHALRVTLQSSRAAFVPPASHYASNSSNANAAPMGMRLRLKSTFNLSGYSQANQVILKAMQQYGLIMADNGSSMYVSGAPDDRWDNDDLHNLGNVTASDFEVVLMNPIYTSSNYPEGANPSISSFTASSSSVPSGTPVTLTWSATGGPSYYIVSPGVGAVRGTAATVNPTKTTTYTLYATNQFGRATATTTVAVQ